jgi:hypothetical protein
MRIRILIFLLDEDPDPTFHPDANLDPYPDPSFKKGSNPGNTCSAKLGSYSINFGLCLQIDADPDPDFYLMRMRIQMAKMMRILEDPDPQHSMEDLENNALSSLLDTEPAGGVSATPPPLQPLHTHTSYPIP